MTSVLQTMQHIDRRIIYLAVAVVLIVSLVAGRQETAPAVLPPVNDFYTAVDTAPAAPGDGKIITVGMTFAANTMAENGNQARAIIRHLMLTKKRFAIIAISEPQGAKNGTMLVQDLADRYGYKYGEDWISFGYQVGTLAFYKSFPWDIPGILKEDAVEKKPLASFPIMKNIRSVRDVAMHIEITASNSVFDWVQLVQPTTNPRLKIGYACTGVMASEAYPLLDSGQLTGMLPGLKGAADYEQKVDALEAQLNPPLAALGTRMQLPNAARKLMFSQSAAHAVIILFIILGNLGVIANRLQRRRGEKKEAA